MTLKDLGINAQAKKLVKEMQRKNKRTLDKFIKLGKYYCNNRDCK